MTDHKRIWLENANTADPSTGRLWCQDKAWPDDPEDGEPTEYVRADIVKALEAASAAETARAVQRRQDMIEAQLYELGAALAERDDLKDRAERAEAALREIANLQWDAPASIARDALSGKGTT